MGGPSKPAAGVQVASPFATLSARALSALVWLRDTDHHKAGWLEPDRNGNLVEARGPWESWTHLRIQGRGKTLTLSMALHAEISPYIVATVHPGRIWVPNMVGLQVLVRAGR